MSSNTTIQSRTKGKQLTYEDFVDIASCLNRGMNLTDTAKYVHCHVSTVKREIDRHKILKIQGIFKNKCGRRLICQKYNVCGNTNCTHLCSKCILPSVTCNDYCPYFTTEPQCKYLKKYGGVCNGCQFKSDCKINKFYYNPDEALVSHKSAVSECKKGPRISTKQLEEFTLFLKPLIEHRISLDVIKHKYPEQFPYSIQTVYSWINSNLLPGICNLDLPKKCRYNLRSNKEKPPKNDYSHLEGRLYDDFITFISNNPYTEVVEMDTVEGKNKTSYILTLLFRRSNYMLAFKLLDHTSNSVTKVFDMIKSSIGLDKFKQFFPVILTDRGSEFIEPDLIEFDHATGEKLTSIFYCDSRQSQQKGKIEKNHEELRKIFPKGFDFNTISQKDLDLALCHVNSYPRKIFNYSSPIHIGKSYLPECILELNHCYEISISKVILTPRLIHK